MAPTTSTKIYFLSGSLICFVAILVSYLPVYDNLPTVEDFAKKHGFQFEYHNVTTEDGYILEHHRLYSSEKVHSCRTIVLNHGLMDHSTMWVAFSSKRSLGLYLTHRGYDVWLLNTRGSGVSRKHVTLATESGEYWSFGWHEMGIYDLPNTIDYILKTTGCNSIDFIGFSMGVTSFFVMLSEKPEYNKKIDKLVSLGGAVYDVDVGWMMPYTKLYFDIYHAFLQERFNLGYFKGLEFSGSSCSSSYSTDKLNCLVMRKAAGLVSDPNMKATEYSQVVPYIYGPGSSHCFLHYYQIRLSGKFRKLDYGETKNKEMYNSRTPPEYNLGFIKTPTAIFWSPDDHVCSEKGVMKMIPMLPNVVIKNKVALPGFSHAAFFAATNAAEEINEKIYSFLQSKILQTNQNSYNVFVKSI